MKSYIFLFTATLLTMICIVLYEPPISLEEAEETILEETYESEYFLYDPKIFEETCFNFVRASVYSGYAVYEVVQARASEDWRVEAESLKTTLTEYLKSINQEGELILMVLDNNNHERVTVIL